MDNFNCVIEIIVASIRFISFEIKSKQETLGLYGKFCVLLTLAMYSEPLSFGYIRFSYTNNTQENIV
jgi:hypothetical protein